MSDQMADRSIEDVATFRSRAKEWVRANLRLDTDVPCGQTDEASIAHQRQLMRYLFDAGFAGLCWPKEYGGQGLTPEHLRAFTEVTQGYELPMTFHLPTLTILGATLLDFGTEEQKHRYIPAMLSGEELWVQFLSEPTGGSDLAGVLTRATRDGDIYVLNGAKIWTGGAYRSDYALCVCRTNWEVPKHSGISVLIVKIRQPGITVDRIRQVNDSMEFCQEFFDDVQIPVDNLVGKENEGWTVASCLLQHEKLAVGGGHPLGLVEGGMERRPSPGDEDGLVRLAREVGRANDPVARQLVGEGLALRYAESAVIDRVSEAIITGTAPAPSSAILKLFNATSSIQHSELAAKIAGAALVAGAHQESGVRFLARQAGSLRGGSNEIQRNIISERVLGMPREPAADRDVPFKEVQRGGKR
jgi:alkylation response protein AidB-like acyl-CoA dehydrogenase